MHTKLFVKNVLKMSENRGTTSNITERNTAIDSSEEQLSNASAFDYDEAVVNFLGTSDDGRYFNISVEGKPWRKVSIEEIFVTEDKTASYINLKYEDETSEEESKFITFDFDSFNTESQKFLKKYIDNLALADPFIAIDPKDFVPEEITKRKLKKQLIELALENNARIERAENFLSVTIASEEDDIRKETLADFDDRFTEYRNNEGNLPKEIRIKFDPDTQSDSITIIYDPNKEQNPETRKPYELKQKEKIIYFHDSEYTRETLKLLMEKDQDLKFYYNGKEIKNIDKLELKSQSGGSRESKIDSENQSVASKKFKLSRISPLFKTITKKMNRLNTSESANSADKIPLIDPDDEGDLSQIRTKEKKNPIEKKDKDLLDFLIKKKGVMKVLSNKKEHYLYDGTGHKIISRENNKTGKFAIGARKTDDKSTLQVNSNDMQDNTVEIVSQKDNHVIHFNKVRDAIKEFNKSKGIESKTETITWRLKDQFGEDEGSVSETIKDGKKQILLTGNVKYEFHIKVSHGQKLPFIYMENGEVKLSVRSTTELNIMKKYANNIVVGDPSHTLSEIISNPNNVVVREEIKEKSSNESAVHSLKNPVYYSPNSKLSSTTEPKSYAVDNPTKSFPS